MWALRWHFVCIKQAHVAWISNQLSITSRKKRHFILENNLGNLYYSNQIKLFCLKRKWNQFVLCKIVYHGNEVIELKSVNKVGVSGKPTSASISNPSAVSVLREIHSSWCLQRIRKALRPIAKAILRGDTPPREIVNNVQPLLASEKMIKKNSWNGIGKKLEIPIFSTETAWKNEKSLRNFYG